MKLVLSTIFMMIRLKLLLDSAITLSLLFRTRLK
jgi:hypothetical protein